MEVAYYNLSGGINQSLTKTELGLDTKKIYWSDAENVEILQNRGICKQNGNICFLELPAAEAVTGMHEIDADNEKFLFITTYSGKIYVYKNNGNTPTLLSKTLSGKTPVFTNFLDGVLISSEADCPFYVKNNLSIVETNAKDINKSTLTSTITTVYKGRIWIAKDSVIYYSALGSYTDFTTENDAGYIRDFHTDTADIIALKPYKDYLAIYKKNKVYLLTGTSPDDFAITPFAEKGALSSGSIVNVENKQYFLSNGIFALEQVGELNQIQLGSEISLKIKPEFSKFDKARLNETLALHYENRSQIWFFFPYYDSTYFQTIWINDYVNKCWYKRVLPQNITTAAIYDGYVITADNEGKIYREDYGTSFNGEPVKFMWKSPFLAISSAHHRKTIDEFYFLLDEAYDNNFDFSVYKDYDSEYSDDLEKIYSIHFDHLIWSNGTETQHYKDYWPEDDETGPVWAIGRNTLEKAEISEANYSIQLCVTGTTAKQACGIIGLQFREIYNDD